MRYAAILEYDGSDYAGWQRQPNAQGIQEIVEAALSSVAAHEVRTVCAGRTDAGVHARGQVVHFDSSAARTLRGWVLGANSNLPTSVRVLWVGEVADEFSARFSAVERSYSYRIVCCPVAAAIERNQVWCQPRSLDVARMRTAATLFIGEHDFSAFRAADCQAGSASRFVSRLDVDASGSNVIIRISANAFLKNMVRIVTGVLVAIGSGEREPQWVSDLLESGDRTRSGLTAPAAGLSLDFVRYPRSCNVPRLQTAMIANSK